MESKLEEARERSRTVWDAMASGWETSREDLWEFSRPVSEWLADLTGANLDGVRHLERARHTGRARGL